MKHCDACGAPVDLCLCPRYIYGLGNIAGDETDRLDADKPRTCRLCGCTDPPSIGGGDCSQCVEKTGHPCYWVAEDLCSACVGETAEKR